MQYGRTRPAITNYFLCASHSEIISIAERGSATILNFFTKKFILHTASAVRVIPFCYKNIIKPENCSGFIIFLCEW